MSSIITLTIPDRVPVKSGKLAKRILNRFLTQLRRRYEGVQYVWIMEFQRSGQPHFHVLTNITERNINRDWLGKKWSQAVLVNPPIDWLEHRAIANDVYKVHSHKKAWERLRSVDGAQRYILSYIGKEHQKAVPKGFDKPGRFWGMSRGVAIEDDPTGTWPIDDAGLRAILAQAGMLDLAGWEWLPQYIHVPPITESEAVDGD